MKLTCPGSGAAWRRRAPMRPAIASAEVATRARRRWRLPNLDIRLSLPSHSPSRNLGQLARSARPYTPARDWASRRRPQETSCALEQRGARRGDRRGAVPPSTLPPGHHYAAPRFAAACRGRSGSHRFACPPSRARRRGEAAQQRPAFRKAEQRGVADSASRRVIATRSQEQPAVERPGGLAAPGQGELEPADREGRRGSSRGAYVATRERKAGLVSKFTSRASSRRAT